MDPERPSTGTCEKHGLRVAPDGLCTLCRRANAPPPEAQSGGAGTTLIGLMALLAVSAGLYMVFGHKTTTSEPVVKSSGPPLEAQIAAVDKQLELLRIARKNGELDGAGLNALSALETKRAVLVAEKTAQDKNQ